MRRKHRLYSSALALCLLAGVPAASQVMLPVLAETQTGECTITINNKEDDVTYKAYQIFAGTYSTKEDGLLSDIVWGTGVDKDAVLNELTKEGSTWGLTSSSTAEEVAAKVSDQTKKDFLAVVRAHTTGTSAVNVGNTITVPSPGYYLITETRNDGAEQAFILELAGKTAQINPKTAENPIAEKHVHENDSEAPNGLLKTNDLNYQDIADYTIGEEIHFLLTTQNLPSEEKIADWNEYFITFNDVKSDGLTIQDVQPKLATINADGTWSIGEDLTKFTKTDTADGFTVLVKLKENNVYDKNFAGKAVVLDVTAYLNNDAVAGVKDTYAESNFNTYTLTYTSNPEGQTETTDEDRTLVFTYQLDVTKEDKATQKKLQDAQFKLFRMNGESKEYYKEATDTKTLSFENVSADDATILTSNEEGTFSVKGLDEGVYYLEEVQAPDGYNKLSSLVKVTISAQKNEEAPYAPAEGAAQSPKNFNTALSVTTELVANPGDSAASADGQGDLTAGTAGITITNSKGTHLPTTGGMGTTMFYTVGGVMVAGAALFLITGKRMKKEQ